MARGRTSYLMPRLLAGDGQSGSYHRPFPLTQLTISAEAFGSGDNVFTELKKLIAMRSLTITVAVLDDEQIRINEFPRSIGNDASRKPAHRVAYFDSCIADNCS
jgi:hypothetical protein